MEQIWAIFCSIRDSLTCPSDRDSLEVLENTTKYSHGK